MGTTVCPSVKLSTDTSGPVRNSAAAGGAEGAVLHHAFHSGHGRRLVLADKNALAQGKAIRLYHHRVFALRADICPCAFRIAECLVARGGDAVFFHQIL